MDSPDKSCQSCTSSYYCDFVMNNTTKTCPCKICLLKMICTDSCKLFEDAYEDIFNFKPSPHKGA